MCGNSEITKAASKSRRCFTEREEQGRPGDEQDLQGCWGAQAQECETAGLLRQEAQPRVSAGKGTAVFRGMAEG